MNAVPKLVASRTLTDASAWVNSQVIGSDAVDAVRRERRDVIIIGSLNVVHALMAEDLIDEYRLLTFPTILGTGERLFPAGSPLAYLECLSAEQVGAAVLARYGKAPAWRRSARHAASVAPSWRQSCREHDERSGPGGQIQLEAS